ncbi:putative F-box domain-containing protein [Rosa chinensis]|uniref:Putative F-box domain-containing protein n=1 Tax=Rosa chinensis TaxID=74649 RepID=A0A2P6SF95_ROSCH|nr:putative F-box domain-containing protein [Rosa chinensis]
MATNSMADDGGVHKRGVADLDGVLDEILARLPVKSLMRFRCVCTSWRALISQSHFVTKHFNYASKGFTENTSRLLISMSPLQSQDCEASKDLSLDCEALKELKDDGDAHLAIGKLEFPKDMVLWNPCTGQSNLLPKPTDHCIPQFHGFGYDSTNDDYKVVRGYNYIVRGSEETMVQVFRLKSEEKFREMLPLPSLVGLRIWMMKEYGVKESWTEVASFDLPKDYKFSLVTPLCILENGEGLIASRCDFQSLVFYSFKEQTFRNVFRTHNGWKFDGLIYRETLVSPVTSGIADISKVNTVSFHLLFLSNMIDYHSITKFI